jgi:hypothetical protein
MRRSHHRESVSQDVSPRGWPSLVKFALVVMVLAGALAPVPSHAAGDVGTCSEPALDAALVNGGVVTFSCSGTIMVSSTKVISKDTTLDATGQKVSIGSKIGKRVSVGRGEYCGRCDCISMVCAPGRNPFALSIPSHPE